MKLLFLARLLCTTHRPTGTGIIGSFAGNPKVRTQEEPGGHQAHPGLFWFKSAAYRQQDYKPGILKLTAYDGVKKPLAVRLKEASKKGMDGTILKIYPYIYICRYISDDSLMQHLNYRSRESR